MSIPGSASPLFLAATGAAGYEIERSLRFNSADSARLTKTFSSSGNQKTWSWNCWFKRSKLNLNLSLLAAYSSGSVNSYVRFNSSNFLDIYSRDGAGSQLILTTDQVFRDPASWTALTLVADTTQSTASDRFKVYINGSQITSFSSSTYPALNANLAFNGTFLHSIGDLAQSAQYFDGYIADIHFVDGQALAPTDFGEFDDNNLWQPIERAGTYGTNGFHLDFSNNSSVAALGTDTSGNSNTFTVNNISVTAGPDNDSLRDSPVNGDPTGDTGVGGEISSNYATLSGVHNSGTNVRLGEGGLEFFSYDGNYQGVVATIAMTHKTYWETKVPAALTYFVPGIIRIDTTPVQSGSARLGVSATEYPNSATIWPDGQAVYYNGSSVYSTGAIWSAGDIIGHAYDPATGNYYGWRNGVALNSGNAVATLDTSYTYAPAVVTAQSSLTNSVTINFGQGPFTYGNAGTNRAAASYKCLCTSNLPDPTIADGSTAMNVATWTGSGAARNITGLNHSTGLAWIKYRSGNLGSGTHYLFDSNRGANKYVSSNAAGAEDGSYTDLVTGFLSDGFSLGADAGSGGVNYSASGYTNEKYVGWSWAGGSSNTTIAAGSLNSSAYNQSEVWSGYPKTGTQPAGAEWTYAFNGNLTNGVYPNTNVTTTLTIDTSDRPTWSGSIRIYGVNYGGVVTINGTNVSSATSGSLGWFDLSSILGSSGTLASFSLTNSGGNYAKINAVELDGKLLIDAGVSVTNIPSIASTVSANPSAGFSSVTYTGNATSGSTVGHGLNAEPELVICKNRSTAVYWVVYFKALGATKVIFLNTTNAAQPDTNWANTTPTSSVFSIGAGTNQNGSGNNQLAYCFSPVEGYSAFGTYTGNGSATDGPFVYTGFRPRWILFRSTASGKNWFIYDTERDLYNVAENYLIADDPGAEAQFDTLDVLSNGFKLRASDASFNASGAEHIWAAFAEHPFKTARAR